MRTKIRKIKEDESFLNKEVLIKGWVRSIRHQKKFSFIEVNDGSSLANLQVIVHPSLPHYEKLVDHLTTGSSVAVSGKVVESPGVKQNVEIHASQVTVLGFCDATDYPLQKKRHSFEFLRSIAHLRPRTNTIGAVMRIRNTLSYATHRFFQQQGFYYLQTPIITLSNCEGGGKLFQVTTPDEQDFFSKPAYLTVSGQLNCEIYASALSDVYTFGPTFRAENSNTSRHLAEFWMIEPEMAFADNGDNMAMAEAYIKAVIQEVLDKCPEDLEFFDRFISPGKMDQLKKITEHSFEHITYTEAINILKNHSFEFPVTWGSDLQTEHERYLCETHFKKPVFVHDYPTDIKAFYMRENEDGKTVAAMDLLVHGVGELIGGSQREERFDLLEKKMDQIDLNKEDYWWYSELRKYGSVPHAGFGVGFERLVQFITGMENIRDVTPFPRYPGHASF